MASAPQPPKGQQNVMNALILHQAKRETEEAKKQLQQVSKEKDKVVKEHEKVQKKHQNLEKEHKDTKKELHQLKLKFDGNYAFDYKQTKKKTMENVRAAKKTKTAVVRAKSSEQKKA